MQTEKTTTGIRRLSKTLITAAAAILGTMGAASAQDANYPSRPVKLVVPFSAGGAPDTMSRTYADQLKERLGQPVIIENRPGASGSIGAAAVARAPADGYTMVLNTSAMSIMPWVVKQPFDFRKDLTPIAYTAFTPYVVTVSPKLPVRSLDEFIAYAKKNPGKLTCGTYGVASPPHLALELLMDAAGIDIVHASYTNFGQAFPDLLSGQLDCSIDPPTLPAPHVATGRIHAIAHTGTQPMALFPTIDAIGKRYPDIAVLGWQAIYAPAGLPTPLRERLISDWRHVLDTPEVKERIRTAGFETSNMSMDDFSKLMEADYEKFGRIIKARNIRLN